MSYRTSGLAVLAATMLAATDATAAATRVAVVVHGAGAGSDKPAGFVAHYVQALLARDPKYRMIDLETALGSRTAAKAERAMASAGELVQQGRAAYESLDLDLAVDLLTKALSKYEQQVAYVEDMKPIADLFMLLGATHMLRGEERLGSRRLAQAVMVYPGVEPDPRIFNPAMRKVYDQAVAEASQRPQGSLSLSSNPSYARVYVDGRFVGVTPLAVDGQPEGQHFVRMVRPGYRAWGEVAELPGRMEISEVGSLKDTAKLGAYETQVSQAVDAMLAETDSSDAPLPASIAGLGRLLDAEQLVLVEVRLDGERIQVLAAQYDLQRGELMHRARQIFAYDSRPDTYEREVRDMLQRGFELSDPGGDGGDSEDEDELDGGALSFGRCDRACRRARWWLLGAGVGGGAVVAGVGAYLLNAASLDHEEFLHTEQTNTTRLDELRSAGKKKTLIGDILVGVGGVGAVTAAVLAYVWLPRRGARDVEASGTVELSLAPMSGGAAVVATWGF